MSMITTLTRMWLTKSTKPFLFTSEYDKILDYSNCDGLGLYVHIPFCLNICSFCPYCKTVYNKETCEQYIDALIKEIHLVGKMNSEKKQVTSLYFGGGSPALATDRLKEIIDTLNLYFDITEGIGIELHPSDVKTETLTKLKDVGVTKVSIGIQSFNNKFLSVLGRKTFDLKSMSSALSAVTFETVSMDFIFALPNQTIEDLKEDIAIATNIGANHFAIYPFISFSFTGNDIPLMSKKEKRALLDEITIYCKEKGYKRDSIWTFSTSGSEKYSSMTRDNFLGFGCSATTLLKDQFKINTFDIDAYKQRISSEDLPTSLTIKFTEQQKMLYYLFWTAYTTRVSLSNFEKFFGKRLTNIYGFELFVAQKLGFVTKDGDEYKMTLKGAFYYHHYENYYTLSYIDKMWGIMKETTFPDKLTF